MKKLCINGRRHVRISSFIAAAVLLILISIIINLYAKGQAAFSYVAFLLALGIVFTVLIGRSKFLYRILERTDSSTITFYNNLFGLKLNRATFIISTIASVRISQNEKKYYEVALVLDGPLSIPLGVFAVRSQAEEVKDVAAKLIEIPSGAD